MDSTVTISRRNAPQLYATDRRYTCCAILDARGNPTVELDVLPEDGSHDWASIPSGAVWRCYYKALLIRDASKVVPIDKAQCCHHNGSVDYDAIQTEGYVILPN